MEDILEEIVGEIYNEYDEEEESIYKIDENTYIFNGSVAIYEVEDILEIAIEEGDYDTLSRISCRKTWNNTYRSR